MELQIHTLQKQIEARLNEITGLQQFWLRNQSELVKTLKDVQKQSEDMEYLKKQYTILLQKKLRIEGFWQTLLDLKVTNNPYFPSGLRARSGKKGRAKTFWQTPLFPLGFLEEYRGWSRSVKL